MIGPASRKIIAAGGVAALAAGRHRLPLRPMQPMDNYFELYGIAESFNPDAAVVKAKFYELSRATHPDKYARADSAAQLQALTLAAQNNKAYKTLTNPELTMAYVLRLNGVMQDEEKYTLPPDFLMEMMELNEAVSEYELEPTDELLAREAREVLNEHLTAWETEAAALTTRYQPGPGNAALLADIKDMYYRKKYLLRIMERIAKFAAR